MSLQPSPKLLRGAVVDVVFVVVELCVCVVWLVVFVVEGHGRQGALGPHQVVSQQTVHSTNVVIVFVVVEV